MLDFCLELESVFLTRGQDLVNQVEVIVLIDTKLKLGVGNNDAMLLSVVAGLGVELDRDFGHLGSVLFANDSCGLAGVNVFVVIANLCLGAGGPEGLGEGLALLHTGGERNIADGSLLLIL